MFGLRLPHKIVASTEAAGPERLSAALERRARQGRLNAARAGAFAAMLHAVPLLWISGQTAVAQGTAGVVGLPADWHHTVVSGTETYIKGERSDAVVMAKQLPATTTQGVMAVIDRLFPLLGCHGTPPSPSGGLIEPFGNRPRCFAAFAPSPGGYWIAVGAAVTPVAEAEGVRLAQQLSGAGNVPATAPPAAGTSSASTASTSAATVSSAAPADAVATDAALAAALDAVPERNLPAHMVLRQGFTYNGTGVVMINTLWMLFANGVATTCTEWDPGKQAPTAEALASVEEVHHCSTTRWRRVAGGAIFDDGPKDEPVRLEDIPPPARGTRFDGSFESSSVLFSSLSQWGVPGTLVIDSSAMSLSRDGELWFGRKRSSQTNGDSTTKREPALAGRYMIDRYLIAVAANGKIERHFFFALSKPTEKDILFYFDGSLLRTSK